MRKKNTAQPGDFSPPPDSRIGEKITKALDDALVTFRAEEYKKGRGSGESDVALHRIGSGYIGMECGRALAYKYHKAEKEEREGPVSKGELQRHAESGFWTEQKTAEWLELAGFDIRTVNPETGSQYGYKSAWDDNQLKYRIAGEIDGVLCGGPVELPYPVLWESKKGTAKKFAKFEKGVKKADPEYYGQLQTNMLEMEVHYTLFSMLNLDTMKYYWELIPFDAKEAQRLQDRAANVLQTKEPEEMPRITTDKNDFRCKFCDYAKRCWAERKLSPEAPTAPPPWMKTKPTMQAVKDKFPF